MRSCERQYRPPIRALKKREPILSNAFARGTNLEVPREPFFFRAFR
jgi:hypothetical protein